MPARFKTDLGDDFVYGESGAGPHAVTTVKRNGATVAQYGYDANGDMVTRAGVTIGWTSFNKPLNIGSTSYSYDVNYNRITKTSGTGSTIYVDKLYEKITKSGVVDENFFVYAGSRLVAISKTDVAAQAAVVATGAPGDANNDGLIDSTDVTVVIDQVLGKSVAAGDPNCNVDASVNVADAVCVVNVINAVPPETPGRGIYYVHSDYLGSPLYIMNARLYDPLLGRFIGADSVIPDVFNGESLNPYSYVLNNPFAYTDPSGHEYEGAFGTCSSCFSFNDPGSNLSFMEPFGPNPAAALPNSDHWMGLGATVDLGIPAGANSVGQGDLLSVSQEAMAQRAVYEAQTHFESFSGSAFPTGRAGLLGDFAVGFSPAGVGADIYGAVTGETLFGGEKLSGFERAVGLVPLGSELMTVFRGGTKVVGAAGEGMKEFDVVPYRPTNTPFVNHHGINDVWATNNIPGYVSRAADNPTMALSVDGHKAAHRAGTEYLMETFGSVRGTTRVLSPRQMQEMAERQFDAANVPQDARVNFYREFNKYIYRE